MMLLYHDLVSVVSEFGCLGLPSPDGAGLLVATGSCFEVSTCWMGKGLIMTADRPQD